jgi:hypothetical protein
MTTALLYRRGAAGPTNPLRLAGGICVKTPVAEVVKEPASPRVVFRFGFGGILALKPDRTTMGQA